METGGIGALEEAAGAAASYVPLINVEDDDDDDARLNQLGYKQELSRSLSAIANFSVTFSIVSILTGLTTMYSYGLRFGGPIVMIWGWPIIGLLTLIVGLSMAEICSAYPTSGGLYFWSAKLSGRDWGPIASWFTGWYGTLFVLTFVQLPKIVSSMLCFDLRVALLFGTLWLQYLRGTN